MGKGVKPDETFVVFKFNKGDCVKCIKILNIFDDPTFLSKSKLKLVLVFSDFTSSESYEFLKDQNINSDSFIFLSSDSLQSLEVHTSSFLVFSDFKFVQKENLLQYKNSQDLLMDLVFYGCPTILPSFIFHIIPKPGFKIGEIFHLSGMEYAVASNRDSLYSINEFSIKNISSLFNLPRKNCRVANCFRDRSYISCLIDSLGSYFYVNSLGKAKAPVFCVGNEDYYPNPDIFKSSGKGKWMLSLGSEFDSTHAYFLGNFSEQFTRFNFFGGKVNTKWLNDKKLGIGKIRNDSSLNLFIPQIGHLLFVRSSGELVNVFPRENLIEDNTFHIRHLVLSVAEFQSYYIVLYSIQSHLYAAIISKKSGGQIKYKRLKINHIIGQSLATASSSGFQFINFSNSSTGIITIPFKELID